MRGYTVARSPGNQVWFAARAPDRDPNTAERIARQHNVVRMSQRSNPPATTFIPASGRLDYWTYLSEVIQPEPIEARDMVMPGMLVPLGSGGSLIDSWRMAAGGMQGHSATSIHIGHP